MKVLQTKIIFYYIMSFWELVKKVIKEVEDEKEREKRNAMGILITSWVIFLLGGIIIGYYLK